MKRKERELFDQKAAEMAAQKVDFIADFFALKSVERGEIAIDFEWAADVSPTDKYIADMMKKVLKKR